jgi:predicted PurR-regulated permease PerM
MTASTRFQAMSFLVITGLIGIVLTHGLVPAVFFGLLIHTLIRVLAAPIEKRLPQGVSRLIALTLLALVVVVSLSLVGASIVDQILSADWPALFDRLGIALMSLREELPDQYQAAVPEDATSAMLKLADVARDHLGTLSDIGLIGLKSTALLLLFGVIAAMLAVEATPSEHPLGGALAERAQRIALSFRKILGAQAKIALINTVLTALYLWGLLPALHIHLPHTSLLVLATFLTAFIPVIGNLMANSAIVLLSFMVSPMIALGSLTFLIVIHKLEYFLNARIVGKEVNCAAWELLLAMVFMETLFGVSGLIAGPILYSWIKLELKYLPLN